MATGSEMLDALSKATSSTDRGSTFEIGLFDAYDLMKLGPDDLVAALRIEREDAERVSDDLARGRLDELGRAMGLRLVVDNRRRNLIRWEGFRRAAEVLRRGDDRPLSEVLEDLDQIRHPERYPV